jgi:predicted Zn-dependent peptidase
VHHARHYTAKNSVLVIAAPNPSLDLALPFGALPMGTRLLADAPNHLQDAPKFELVPNASSQVELRVSLRAIAENAKERPALELLLRILDDGMSTRLYRRICDEQGLCYDVSANFDGYEDDGIVDFAASVHSDRCNQVTHEMLQLMCELAEHCPTEEELSDAKQRAFWHARGLFDAPEEMAGFFAGGKLFGRFESPYEHFEKIDAVTREEVRTLTQFLVKGDRLNVVAVGNPSAKERAKLEKTVRDFRG